MLTRITYFTKNSKLDFLTWVQLFSNGCGAAGVYKEVQGWSAMQEDRS